MKRHELACIAHSAIKAMRQLRRVQDELIKQSIEFATGWTEGDGPEAK